MTEQEVVNEVAEPTVQADSTPAEDVAEATPVEEPTEQPAKTQETPVDESVDTEKKVSEAVPYERFSEKAQEAKELKERNAYLEAMQQEKTVQPPTDVPRLDEQSELAVEQIINSRLEQRVDDDFKRAHKDDLSDRLVETAYEAVIREKMAKKVPYIDREESLKEAKKLIDSRLKKEVTQAKDEGIEEGNKIAEQKAQNAPVGVSGKNPEVDATQLSAADYAAKMNIPRSN